MLIFWFFGSKVKGQGKKSIKICLFWADFGQGAMCGAIQDQRGSGGVLLAGCQLILASCQKLENDRRPPLDGFASIGKVPKLVKVPEPKHRAIARCEVCASIYITYISVSKSTPLAVTGPHGQLASNPFLDKVFC